jgi:hypothetical protein
MVTFGCSLLGCFSVPASAASLPQGQGSSLKQQVSDVLAEANRVQPGAVGSSCSGSTCTTFGSSTAPLFKGFKRAADQLAGLSYPTTTQGQADALIAALRKTSADYQRLTDHRPSNPTTAVAIHNLQTDAPALKIASRNLRRALGLPAPSNGGL